MVSLTPSRLLKLPTILKMPELLLGLIILMIARMGGDDGAALPLASDPDGNIFGILVIYGYFYILLMQLVGIATGDKAPVQETLFALVGFIFWLSAGSLAIADASDLEVFDYHKKMKAVGALSILNSFIYAAEGVLHALNLKSGDDD